MTDLHVHLRDGVQSAKETIEHGLAVASMCGIRRVADMPNCSPALTSRAAVLDRLALASPSAKRHRVSYSVHMGLVADPDQIREAVATHSELFPLVLGLKLFAGQSTGNMGIVDIDSQRLVFQTLTEAHYRGVLLVHCEKESLLRPELFVAGRWETHSLARPAAAEVESVRDMIGLMEETGFPGHLHICHISTKGALELVCAARDRGLAVSCGATAHHSLLTVDDAAEHGRYLKMNPPLRSVEDRDAIYAGLVDGSVDYVESDHAPHTLEDKEKGASGIPGFAGSLMLLSRLKADGVPTERLVDIFSRNALTLFGLDGEERPLPDRIMWRARKAASEYPFDPFAIPQLG